MRIVINFQEGKDYINSKANIRREKNTPLIEMANFNNYRPLSLQNTVLGTVAANLLKESNILLSISKFQTKPQRYVNNSLQVWEDTVDVKLLDEISTLGLPKSLSKLLIDTAKRMSGHVRSWKEFHENYLQNPKGEDIYFDVPVLEKLRWTAAWSVDYRKTAEELVISDALDIVKQFKISCLYCLEENVSVFWGELPIKNQKYFCRKNENYLFDGGLGKEFWWPYLIKGQESKLDSLTRESRTEPGEEQITFRQWAFQCSARTGNKAAAEYFLKKLTVSEKDSSLMSATKAVVGLLNTFRCTTRTRWEKFFPLQKAAEALRYLLSVMTPDQQMRIFQADPLKVFEWSLVWPLQEMFLDIADGVWLCIPDSDRDEVLCMIYRKFTHSGDHCVKLFQDFFRRIPSDFWIGFADRQCEPRSYFDNILFWKNVKEVEIFFRSLNDAARRRLMFSKCALDTFHTCLSKGELDFVELCLREVSLTQEEKMRLKEDFMRHLTSIKVNKMRLKTRKWSNFFQLLDETKNDGKRCSEGETSTESKKRKTQL